MNECKKFLVTGLGSISERHRANLKSLFPKCEITAVSASGNLNRRRPKFADKILENLSQLGNENFDYIFLCSPSSMHLNELIQLKGKSANCFIEKPVITDSQLDEDCIVTIPEFFTRLSVGYCLRHHEALIQFKKFIDDGFLGKITHINIYAGHDLSKWRPDKKIEDTVTSSKNLGGGVLLELSHELDYLLWIFGDVEIECALIQNTIPQIPEIDSIVSIMGTCGQNNIFNIQLDLISPFPKRQCIVSGQLGDLVWNYFEDEVKFRGSNGEKILFKGSNNINEMYLRQMETLFSKDLSHDVEVASWEQGLEVVRLISEIRKINE